MAKGAGDCSLPTCYDCHYWCCSPISSLRAFGFLNYLKFCSLLFLWPFFAFADEKKMTLEKAVVLLRVKLSEKKQFLQQMKISRRTYILGPSN
mmetsp:Transcript_7221/g.10977  ORF Transcript_7221/g.10977 Transcript_7221/m.10977 type:complete len:93 (-) Transcript_7221:3214-3492(-)